MLNFLFVCAAGPRGPVVRLGPELSRLAFRNRAARQHGQIDRRPRGQGDTGGPANGRHFADRNVDDAHHIALIAAQRLVIAPVLGNPDDEEDVVPTLAGFDADRAELRRTGGSLRSEEHTSELQSLMRISYAVF